MAIAESQRCAAAKYSAMAYDRVVLMVPKGHRSIIQDHAEAGGESVNGFINRAIDELMNRDGETELND